MVKLSEKLFERAKGLWDEASGNPFVTGMAKGTLDTGLFRTYLLQDYYYLEDYIGILERMKEEAKDPVTAAFLGEAVEATEYEKDVLHTEDMKRFGITDEEIESGSRTEICAEYLNYLGKTARQGTLQGLAALLQCSWCYAYIAQEVTARYQDVIVSSPYFSWFQAYTSPEYSEANRRWIDALDREAFRIGEDEAENLVLIFETCARFENRFWNAVFDAGTHSQA